MKSQLIDFAKRNGWRSVCKHFVENGTGSFSETEVTEMLTAVAQKVYRDLKPDQAFAKLYSASDADGELARRTTLAARNSAFAKAGQGQLMPLMPTQVGGEAARNINADEPDAYKKLVAMAEKMRAASPEMTLAQAFERTYTSPEVKELAELEGRQARSRLPTTGARVG